MKRKARVNLLLVLGDANSAKVEIEFFRNAAVVEQMFAIEDNDVRRLAAVFLSNENVAMAETAIGLTRHEDGFLLLLNQLLVKIEIVGFEDLVATFVN